MLIYIVLFNFILSSEETKEVPIKNFTIPSPFLTTMANALVSDPNIQNNYYFKYMIESGHFNWEFYQTFRHLEEPASLRQYLDYFLHVVDHARYADFFNRDINNAYLFQSVLLNNGDIHDAISQDDERLAIKCLEDIEKINILPVVLMSRNMQYLINNLTSQEDFFYDEWFKNFLLAGVLSRSVYLSLRNIDDSGTISEYIDRVYQQITTDRRGLESCLFKHIPRRSLQVFLDLLQDIYNSALLDEIFILSPSELQDQRQYILSIFNRLNDPNFTDYLQSPLPEFDPNFVFPKDGSLEESVAKIIYIAMSHENGISNENYNYYFHEMFGGIPHDVSIREYIDLMMVILRGVPDSGHVLSNHPFIKYEGQDIRGNMLKYLSYFKRNPKAFRKLGKFTPTEEEKDYREALEELENNTDLFNDFINFENIYFNLDEIVDELINYSLYDSPLDLVINYWKKENNDNILSIIEILGIREFKELVVKYNANFNTMYSMLNTGRIGSFRSRSHENVDLPRLSDDIDYSSNHSSSISSSVSTGINERRSLSDRHHRSQRIIEEDVRLLFVELFYNLLGDLYELSHRRDFVEGFQNY